MKRLAFAFAAFMVSVPSVSARDFSINVSAGIAIPDLCDLPGTAASCSDSNGPAVLLGLDSTFDKFFIGAETGFLQSDVTETVGTTRTVADTRSFPVGFRVGANLLEDKLKIYARTGIHTWEVDAGVGTPFQDGDDFYWGLGVQHNVLKVGEKSSLGYRIDWSRYDVEIAGASSDYDVWTIGVSANYSLK